MALILSVGAVSAQNYIVVNSEKVFKSVAAYTKAVDELDRLAKQYEAEVQQKFTNVETLYNQYQKTKAQLSASKREEYEQAILINEREAHEYQESIFGKDGALMQKRIELIQPIQKQIFNMLDRYAKQVGADIVLDSSNNPTLLYTNPKIEHTERLIQFLKK